MSLPTKDELAALWLLAGRSLRQHALATVLTALGGALSCGLVMAVFAINQQSREAFSQGATGFDAVLGARGSKLQLVLNAVFHLQTSPGNIPYRYYQAMKANPQVAIALPYAVGDNYHGYRIVGTELELFNVEVLPGRKLRPRPGGRLFDPAKPEVVVGSFAADKLGLKVGDRIHPFHGLDYDPSAQHAEIYEVVGLLEPTGTPNDKALWIPLDAFYRLGGHVLRGDKAKGVYVAKAGESIPDESKEVSAVLLKFKDAQSGFQLSQLINNQGDKATLAWPISSVMVELMDSLGWAHKVLALVGLGVMLMAALSCVAALVNTLEARRRDFAILRSLGSGRGLVAALLVLESAMVGALGALGGLVVYAGVLLVAAKILRQSTGVVLEVWALHPVFLLAPLGLVVLSAFAGLIPASRVYRQDVAAALRPES
jgi:putative ABC transport system permease protein